jgi:hypothetical protein
MDKRAETIGTKSKNFQEIEVHSPRIEGIPVRNPQILVFCEAIARNP